jgi:hypothetical protein
MLILLASARDEQARALATRYARNGLRMLIPASLSRPGWRWRNADPRGTVALIDGERVLANEIGGVITRLPWVLPCDLPDIRPCEQEYVAAEINAFLLAWLVSLDCPLLNRPSAQCLSGQGWRSEKWVSKACQLGIPTRAVLQRISLRARLAVVETEPQDAITLTVVGSNVVGNGHAVLKRYACRLAAAANVQLLSVRFDSAARGALLLGASLWPDVSDPDVGEAIWDYFQHPATRQRAVVAQ